MHTLRSLLLFLLLVVLGGQATAQRVFEPYNIDPTATGIVLGLGGSITIGSSYLDRRVKGMTEADIKGLDYDRIFPIDRYSTRHFSLKTDEFTDKLLLTSFASPFFLLLDQRGRNNFDEMATIVFQGALLNSALINLTKVTARRPRPFNYNSDVPVDLKMKKSARYSFYSGHVATAAYFSFTTARLHSDLHPDSKARPYIWAAASLLPATVAYGRMRAGKHFFTDVLMGFVAGTTIALVVPSLHRSNGE